MQQLALMCIPQHGARILKKEEAYGLEKYRREMCTKLSSEEIVLTKIDALPLFNRLVETVAVANCR